MENYEKGEVHDLEDVVNLEMSDSVVHMKVNYGSKIRNLMGYAIKKMKEPGVRQLSWNGHGGATTKVVSCAEIMKRKLKGLHQVTDIRFKRTEEYWEPKLEGLERLKVNRDVPAVTILLSKDPLDTSLPGYQPPGPLETFWKQGVKDDQQTRAEKRSKKKPGISAVGEASGSFSMPKKKKRKPGQDAKKDNTKAKKDNKNEAQSSAAKSSKVASPKKRHQENKGGNIRTGEENVEKSMNVDKCDRTDDDMEHDNNTDNIKS